MTFMCKLQELLGDTFECFESLNSFEKVFFVFGSELVEDDFSSMLDLVKDYILRAWIVLKKHLLFWVVSCGRMPSALCLILLRFSMKISAFHSPSVRIHLGNWGMLGTWYVELSAW